MDIRFIGHATFELHEGLTRALIDPFLAPNNPAATLTAEDVDPTHVLVTHAHADHLADAVAVSERTDAQFVALVETASWLSDAGVKNVSDPNLGGTVALAGRLGQAGPGLPQLDHSRRRRHAGQRPGDQPRRHDRLPPRRHLPVRRPEADRQAHARSTSRSSRSAATTRWTATTPSSPPS